MIIVCVLLGLAFGCSLYMLFLGGSRLHIDDLKYMALYTGVIFFLVTGATVLDKYVKYAELAVDVRYI